MKLSEKAKEGQKVSEIYAEPIGMSQSLDKVPGGSPRRQVGHRTQKNML